MTLRVLHLTTHLNIGGISTYIERLIMPLKSQGTETFVLSSGGEKSIVLREKGAVLFELPIRTKNELHPKLWLALPSLVRILRESNIDMMHAHTRITQVLACIAGKLTGIPLVTTCHGFYKRRLGRRFFPAWGNRVIAISQTVADHLVRDFKIPENKVKTVYNAVNLEELDAAYQSHQPLAEKLQYGFQPDDQVVGIISRLVDDKGHEYLIRAVHLLQKDFPKLKLLIVGEGRCRQQFKKLAEDFHLAKKVIFSGNAIDVTQALAAMDIFALPATWREGFGLSIVEAMACRKPTIVTNIWSLNTLIQNGITGILVEPKQIEPLAAAIADLLRHPRKGQSMAVHARKMVEKLFAISRMAREIHETYREVLGSNPTPNVLGKTRRRKLGEDLDSSWESS